VLSAALHAFCKILFLVYICQHAALGPTRTHGSSNIAV